MVSVLHQTAKNTQIFYILNSNMVCEIIVRCFNDDNLTFPVAIVGMLKCYLFYN